MDEIEFYFWLLIYRKYVKIALLLMRNEREPIARFLRKMAGEIGITEISHDLDESNLQKYCHNEHFLKWATK